LLLLSYNPSGRKNGKGWLNFHPVRYTQTVLQNLSLTLDAGKKEIETFRQSTQAVEMKGQAPVIKSPWAIDFFLASFVTSTVRHDGYGLCIECINIDKAV